MSFWIRSAFGVVLYGFSVWLIMADPLLVWADMRVPATHRPPFVMSMSGAGWIDGNPVPPYPHTAFWAGPYGQWERQR